MKEEHILIHSLRLDEWGNPEAAWSGSEGSEGATTIPEDATREQIIEAVEAEFSYLPEDEVAEEDKIRATVEFADCLDDTRGI